MMWNYAQLTMDASLAGGPECYIEALIASGKALGRMQMVPWLAVAGVGGALVTYGGMKLLKYSREKNEAKIEVAKEKLIGDKKDDTEYDGISGECG